MESNIPQEIEDKIDEVYGLESEGAPQWCAAVYGYSLALPEISALKAEVERLRGILDKVYAIAGAQIEKNHKTLNNL